MRRSQLQRRTPLVRRTRLARVELERRAWLQRHTPMARVNRRRHAARHKAQFAAQAKLCRVSLCCVCGMGPSPYRNIDPHHEPTRARGGLDGDTVPLCREHHDERHAVGLAAFELRHGVDLRAIAAELRERVGN